MLVVNVQQFCAHRLKTEQSYRAKGADCRNDNYDIAVEIGIVVIDKVDKAKRNKAECDFCNE